jgi:hypothetical protein
MVPGVYGATPVLSAWLANNSETHYRRATSVALGVLVSNSVCFDDEYNIFSYSFPIYQGGILSSWSFPSKEGPKFRKTTSINLTLYVTTQSILFPPFANPV